MNKLIRRINRNMSVGSATVLISISTLIGVLLGVVRTNLINSNFNLFSTEAYFAAFKLPDFILYTLAAGALSVCFMPVLSDKLSQASRKQAWLLTSSVLNSVSMFMLLICLLLIIFPRPILEHLITPGFSPELLDVTAQIMRLAATGPLIFSVSYILFSVQNVFGRFFFSSISLIFYNLSIIASIYLFKDSMGVVALGAGSAIGGLLCLVIAGFGMNRLQFRHSWLINFRDKSFLQVFKALPFRSFDQGVTHFASIIQTSIASATMNAVTFFNNALLLYRAPISLLGEALGTAIFPHFTKRLSQRRPDLFKKEFLKALRAIIWFSIPAVVISYFCREYLVQVISPRNNSDIAMILAWLCFGIFFGILRAIITRFYYAQKNTLTPLLVTVITFVVMISLSWLLFEHRGVIGLAIATSIAEGLAIVILLAIMVRRDKSLLDFSFIKGVLLIFSLGVASLITAALATNFLPRQLDDNSWDVILKLSLIGIFVFGAHFAVSYLCKLPEAQRLLEYCKNLLGRFGQLFHDKN